MPGVSEKISEGKILKAFMVPGLPHLVHGTIEEDPGQTSTITTDHTVNANGTQSSGNAESNKDASASPDVSAGRNALRDAMREAGEAARAVNPDVLVIYSAQWISVLGHSFQFAANPRGLHVDENWHDLGDFPFDFRVDRDLALSAEELTREKGLATKLVDYEGFPIDTGTLVTLKAFNPDNHIPVMIVSSNIYCGQEDSIKLGEAVGEAIRRSGKRAVIINCSALSHRFLTEDVTPARDRFSRPEDDEWNRKLLELLKQGKNREALAFGLEYAQEAGAEMGFKGFYWMMGALGSPQVPAEVLGYGPLWGTGAAVVKYDLN